MGLTQEDVTQILKLIEESRFNELRLEIGDLKIIVRKGGYISVNQELEPAEPTAPEKLTTAERGQEPDTEIAVPAERDTQRTEVASTVVEEGLITIKSPILGTFYRAPKPGASPFVEVGTFVTEDDTVCIIEVMKLFSSIKAGARGRIAKICAESGQIVEYQQTLFLIKPEENL